MHVKKLRNSVIAVIAMATAGCSSHMYYREAGVYMNAVTDELAETGACASADACQQNQMAFFESGGWKVGPFKGGGVGIQVYKVADPRVADALVERCRQVHAAHPQVAVSIEIQSNAHIDNHHPGTRRVIKQANFPAVEPG